MQTSVIPAYLYQQYTRDEVDQETQLDLKALIQVINDTNQLYIDWFNNLNLPVYHGQSNGLLDWVAHGLYGMQRPTIATGLNSPDLGCLGTLTLGSYTFGFSEQTTVAQTVDVTDDIFHRILQWHLYKADGNNFTISWIKRRVARFIGVDEADTQAISLSLPVRPDNIGLGCLGTLTLGGYTFAYNLETPLNKISPADNQIVITITTTPETFQLATVLKYAILSNVVEVPFIYQFSVEIL
jgi:hypothetical protein